jgi:hypothetical protein
MPYNGIGSLFGETRGSDMSRAAAKLTLNLPHDIYERVRRAAKGMNKPVEQALVTIVAGATPSLENVPPEYRSELEAMEDLENKNLWKEVKRALPVGKQRRLAFFLQKNQHSELTDSEHEELALLRAQADRLMLRRAYAYLLLKYRGNRIPALAELNP